MLLVASQENCKSGKKGKQFFPPNEDLSLKSFLSKCLKNTAPGQRKRFPGAGLEDAQKMIIKELMSWRNSTRVEALAMQSGQSWEKLVITQI